MIEHHPDHNLLAEYAAGTLHTAQAVAISAHLHFCTKCQQEVQRLEQIGGAMIEDLQPQALTEQSFDDLINAIEKAEKVKQHVKPKSQAQPMSSSLPNVVTKLINQEDLKWFKTGALKTAPLTVGQIDHEVSLQEIRAGAKVPKHDHGGVEMTVVLEGSFSDKDGIYQAGDFILKQPGEVHQPVSARNQDCLCLSVQEAPVKLTTIWGKLLNPFLRLRAA
jgi:putative transcriptional regulator